MFWYQFLQFSPLIIDLPVETAVFVPGEIAMREYLKIPVHKCHVRHHLLHCRSYTDMCQYFASL